MDALLLPLGSLVDTGKTIDSKLVVQNQRPRCAAFLPLNASGLPSGECVVGRESEAQKNHTLAADHHRALLAGELRKFVPQEELVMPEAGELLAVLTEDQTSLIVKR
jgi:hypothetical protein